MVVSIDARVSRLEEDFHAIVSTVLDTQDRVKRLEAGQRKHTIILNEHSGMLASHTEMLNEHTSTLASHTETLNGHTQLLNEILRRLPEPR